MNLDQNETSKSIFKTPIFLSFPPAVGSFIPSFSLNQIIASSTPSASSFICPITSSSSIPPFQETFGKEFVRQLILLITAAFSFLVALALNEAITETINLNAPKDSKKNLETKWVYFIIILVFAVVLVALMSAGAKNYVVI